MNKAVALGYAHLTLRHLIRISKVILRLPVEIQGRKYMKQLIDTSDSSLRIDVKSGYTRFDIRNIPELNAVFRKLQNLAGQWLNDAESRRSGGFPVDLMLPSDLLDHPDILELALHDEFLVPASVYLGQVPRLAQLRMFWSPKNQTLTGSQKFHYDHRDTSQIKIFLNLIDICEESGPLCFLPADMSSRFNSRIGYNQGRNEDDLVYSVCPSEALVINTGEAGMGVMVDTGRCLHYGSRQNKKDRLILMIGYIRPNCVKLENRSRVLEPLRYEFAQSLFKNDPVRQYALTVTPR